VAFDIDAYSARALPSPLLVILHRPPRKEGTGPVPERANGLCDLPPPAHTDLKSYDVDIACTFPNSERGGGGLTDDRFDTLNPGRTLAHVTAFHQVRLPRCANFGVKNLKDRHGRFPADCTGDRTTIAHLLSSDGGARRCALLRPTSLPLDESPT
jgi:hypothetical protein